MKIILTEKITKLGNIGDVADVATGYARNYLLPKGKAMRWSRDNIALFETRRAELVARQDAAKKGAEGQIAAVTGVKFHMIRQAGDTGHLYGSVSSRDIARMLSDAGVKIESHQVLLGSPIKTIGAFDTKIALHPDVVVPVKIYVAQTQDEIDALVAGKVLTFGTKKLEEENAEQKAESEDKKEENKQEEGATENTAPESAAAEEKPARKKPVKKESAEVSADQESAAEPAKPVRKKKAETEEKVEAEEKTEE